MEGPPQGEEDDSRRINIAVILGGALLLLLLGYLLKYHYSPRGQGEQTFPKAQKDTEDFIDSFFAD